MKKKEAKPKKELAAIEAPVDTSTIRGRIDLKDSKKTIPVNLLDKIRYCRLLALEECPDIINTMKKVSRGGYTVEKEQAWAMKELLDRGMGKPAAVDVGDSDNEDGTSILDMSSEQLNLLVKRRTVEFLTTLYDSGQLEHFMKKMNSGWRPGKTEVLK